MTITPPPRELLPDHDRCTICGQLVSRSRRFYRDDPRPGKRDEDVERWAHIDCVERELEKHRSR